ncbi:unnamed protein product [Chrysoparadoxa australica]
MVLTDKQRRDLHVAILEYLRDAGFAGSVKALEEEAGLAGVESTGRSLLEKKWISVVRLQRKVMELEGKLEQAQQDLASGVRPGREKGGNSRMLPRAPPQAVLTGHRSIVTSVAVHPIYSVVASGSEDGTVKVWDFETGEYERTLKGHTNVVQAVAFKPDGKLLASCSADISIKLWEFSDGYECIKTLRGHDHNISCVIFIPGGDRLASCSRDHTVKLWEVDTGYCVKTLTGHTDWVRAISASEDGTLLASGGSDQGVRIWALATGTCTLELREHTHVVEDVAFGGADVGSAMGIEGEVTSHTQARILSPHILASASRDKTIKLWNVSVGQCIMSLEDHNNWVRCVRWHPSGAYVLSCSDDRSLRVFDVKTGQNTRKIEDAHGHFVTSLAISCTASAVITGSVDKNLHIWECR